MSRTVKKFAYRIYDVFRGPTGYIGQAGAPGPQGPKGDPGVVPTEYWEHRLQEMKKSNDRLRDRIAALEQKLAEVRAELIHMSQEKS